MTAFANRVAIALTVVALVACAGPQSPAGTSKPPASAAPAAGTLAQWQQKGATVIPPASVGAVSLGSIQVVDQTNGAVSEADARRWALAYLRANAYELWAWNNMQSNFILRSGLSQIPTSVFAFDLNTMAQAQQKQGHVQVTRLVLRRIVIRSVSNALAGQFPKQGYQWKQYAAYLDQVGPSDVKVIDAQGASTSASSVKPGVASPELVGGELATDPLMGDIWVAASDWDCTAINVRAMFGSVCTT